MASIKVNYISLNKFIKENEIKAIEFLNKNEFNCAEKVLKENLEVQTASSLTYDLLIKIHTSKKDYSGLINTLNTAIKNTDRSPLYRKLRKEIILSKLLCDINQV